jgi:CDGSH-type Zn-finger protein
VDLVTEDGTTVHSDRFVVAVCTCRRSKRYPLCDTSHRKRTRTQPACPTPEPRESDKTDR